MTILSIDEETAAEKRLTLYKELLRINEMVNLSKDQTIKPKDRLVLVSYYLRNIQIACNEIRITIAAEKSKAGESNAN